MENTVLYYLMFPIQVSLFHAAKKEPLLLNMWTN